MDGAGTLKQDFSRFSTIPADSREISELARSPLGGIVPIERLRIDEAWRLRRKQNRTTQSLPVLMSSRPNTHSHGVPAHSTKKTEVSGEGKLQSVYWNDIWFLERWGDREADLGMRLTARSLAHLLVAWDGMGQDEIWDDIVISGYPKHQPTPTAASGRIARKRERIVWTTPKKWETCHGWGRQKTPGRDDDGVGLNCSIAELLPSCCRLERGRFTDHPSTAAGLGLLIWRLQSWFLLPSNTIIY
jgi:hypothetical protein